MPTNEPSETPEPNGRLREVRGVVNSSRLLSQDVFESKVSGLPPDQREILSWWFYHSKEEDLSLTTLARQAGVNKSSLSRAFNGTYGAELASLCKTLEAAKDNLTAAVPNPDFIMTSLAKQMWEIFDTTRSLETVMFLWGVKGIGKTECSKEYKRTHNHGRTHYYRCSPALTFGQFVASLAKAMNISSKRHSHLRLRDKIISVLAAGNRLLIIDELHELFLEKPRSRAETAVMICEFIREIYDRAGCGVVLIGTRALVSQFLEGDNAEALEQLLDRGLDPVELPSKPTREDAAALVRHFGLSGPDPAQEPKAAEIVQAIFRQSGLRKLTIHLRAGARRAAKAREPYSWSHFVAAHTHLATITKKRS